MYVTRTFIPGSEIIWFLTSVFWFFFKPSFLHSWGIYFDLSFIAWNFVIQECWEDQCIDIIFFQLFFYAAECLYIAFIVEGQLGWAHSWGRTLSYSPNFVAIPLWFSHTLCCHPEVWDQTESFPFHIAPLFFLPAFPHDSLCLKLMNFTMSSCW